MSNVPTKVSAIVGGITKPMKLLLGTPKSGTYYVDIKTLTGADADRCVPYYFEINSGASRMPKDKAYHFLTYMPWSYDEEAMKTGKLVEVSDEFKCKRNIGRYCSSWRVKEDCEKQKTVSCSWEGGECKRKKPECLAILTAKQCEGHHTKSNDWCTWEVHHGTGICKKAPRTTTGWVYGCVGV